MADAAKKVTVETNTTQASGADAAKKVTAVAPVETKWWLLFKSIYCSVIEALINFT